MKRSTVLLKAFNENQVVIAINSIIGIVGTIFGIMEWVKGVRTIDSYAVIMISMLLAGLAVVALVNLRAQVDAHRATYKQIHRINHLYRDSLTSTVSEAADLCEEVEGRRKPTEDELTAMLLQAEENTLNQICQKIAGIFVTLIKRPVVCSVRTYDDEKQVAVLWARSEKGLERDNREEYNELMVGVGRNTALDESVKCRTGRPSHYFSPDLVKARDANEFVSQRSGWESAYKSCLYVPIICRNGNDGEDDLLGWLYIDTLSQNRLRDDFHLELLAAFSDQMYNFMSIMRSGYNIPEII